MKLLSMHVCFIYPKHFRSILGGKVTIKDRLRVWDLLQVKHKDLRPLRYSHTWKDLSRTSPGILQLVIYAIGKEAADHIHCTRCYLPRFVPVWNSSTILWLFFHWAKTQLFSASPLRKLLKQVRHTQNLVVALTQANTLLEIASMVLSRPHITSHDIVQVLSRLRARKGKSRNWWELCDPW